MAIGIYKIENLINGQCYIGQSIDIAKRWRNERTNAFNQKEESYNYPLSCAIRKYGLENFSFEIIEECRRDELNEKEIKWIAYYDSYHNGYNQTPGGDTVIHMSKLTPQEAEEIIKILFNDKDGIVSHRQLATDYGVSPDTIQAINAGRQWYNDDYTYPLHISKFDPRYKQEKKTTVKVEKPKRFKPLPVTKEELEHLLKENNGNFTKVGKIFNISDNGLRKWCIKLGLPTHASDYKPPKETKEDDPNYRRKVHCIEEDLIFDYASEAARWLVEQGKSKSFNSSKNHIPKVCQGERKTHAGYHWEYV